MKDLLDKLEDKKLRGKVLIAIICLAFFLRIVFFTFYWTNKPLTIDMQEYILLGKNVAQGVGFNYGEEEALGHKHYSRPPLYPFFLAAIFSIFGVNLYAVRVVQTLLGGFNCLLIYLIARKIFNVKAGLIVAFLSAIYLPFIWFSAHILSETLFSTLFLVHIALLLTKGSNYKLLISGIFLGLSILCRPVALFFIPFALFWLAYIHKGSLPKILKTTSIFIIGFFLMLVPWIIRNYITFNQFVLVHSSGGVNFWLSNHPLSLGDGDLAANPQLKTAHKEFQNKYAAYSREELDKIYYREAFKYIKANSFQILVLDLKKVFYFWIPIGPSMQLFSFKHKVASYISYFPALLLGIIGIYYSKQQWRKNLILYFVFVSFTLGIMIFFPQERFRIPVIDPCLIIFASITLLKLIDRK